ncbi:MAG: hypothetical protein Q8765_02555, partial [Sweet potato little leaf phytoplasma]|nr:hypothetical protein [Sweet potato little leaf phytoplasma]
QIVTNIIVPKYLGPTNVMVISELIENKIFLNLHCFWEMHASNSFDTNKHTSPCADAKSNGLQMGEFCSKLLVVSQSYMLQQ